MRFPSGGQPSCPQSTFFAPAVDEAPLDLDSSVGATRGRVCGRARRGSFPDGGPRGVPGRSYDQRSRRWNRVRAADRRSLGARSGGRRRGATNKLLTGAHGTLARCYRRTWYLALHQHVIPALTDHVESLQFENATDVAPREDTEPTQRPHRARSRAPRRATARQSRFRWRSRKTVPALLVS